MRALQHRHGGFAGVAARWLAPDCGTGAATSDGDTVRGGSSGDGAAVQY